MRSSGSGIGTTVSRRRHLLDGKREADSSTMIAQGGRRGENAFVLLCVVQYGAANKGCLVPTPSSPLPGIQTGNSNTDLLSINILQTDGGRTESVESANNVAVAASFVPVSAELGLRHLLLLLHVLHLALLLRRRPQKAELPFVSTASLSTM